ncbi:hypothetical protein AAG906_039678 [Vitis piasezkii]
MASRFPVTRQGRNIVLLGIRPYLRTLCSTTWASYYLWGQSAATGHAVAEQKLEIAGTRPVTTKAKITNIWNPDVVYVYTMRELDE